ncbi:MAG: hypothetical protein ACE5G2_05190, partial [Candidatus Krumholzibacteriia bacterium]
MRTSHLTSHLTYAAGLVSLAVLAREAAPGASALPVAFRGLLLGAALLGVAVHAWAGRRAGGGGRAATALRVWLLLLAAAAGLRLVARQPQPDAWNATEEARIHQRFQEVRARVLALESIARDLGDAVHRLATDSSVVLPSPPGERVRRFNALEQLVNETRRRLPQGVPDQLGVQLFDAHGRLLAWAGSVHSEDASTRLSRFVRGQEEVYFRRSGVFTLLTYDRQEGRDAGKQVEGAEAAADEGASPGPRVVVDVPVEVQYQLRNRFLRSWSLAEELSGDGIDVDFIYASSLVPPYLTQTDIELLGDEHRGVQAEFVLRGDD